MGCDMKEKRSVVWAVVYSLLLIAFTVYVALDTFVISKVYLAEKPISGESVQGGNQNVTESIINKNSYKDENISITVTEERFCNTAVYVADIIVSDAKYLKTAFAKGSYGKNVKEKTSEISQDVGAVLAINGDFYGSRESGYVIRNGVIYREEPRRDGEALAIMKDGSFRIVKESDVSAESLLKDGAMHVLSFGPALVENGSVAVTETDEVGKAMESNPRTAVGIIDELHYIFVVSDGRTSASEGLSLCRLAEYMKSLGVKTAYNLDGGGSSTMYFNGEVVNNPTTNGKKISERQVSDIVYIGY